MGILEEYPQYLLSSFSSGALYGDSSTCFQSRYGRKEEVSNVWWCGIDCHCIPRIYVEVDSQSFVKLKKAFANFFMGRTIAIQALWGHIDVHVHQPSLYAWIHHTRSSWNDLYRKLMHESITWEGHEMIFTGSSSARRKEQCIYIISSVSEKGKWYCEWWMDVFFNVRGRPMAIIDTGCDRTLGGVSVGTRGQGCPKGPN